MARRCPICGRGMRPAGWIKPKKAGGGTYGKKIVYKCLNCGYRSL